MHVHLIGVCGAGMSALAGLFVEAKHRVSGSDTSFDPPAGPILEELGVERLAGYTANNLEPKPDLVVIGNVCRADNSEARAAMDQGLPCVSMPGAIATHFLRGRKSFVVAGTHGKTTTASLLAFLLDATGKDPGFFIGASLPNFGKSARVGAAHAPFVIEGDEYDSAFFEKTPKFWQYQPWAALITSIEHDHIDIYPNEESYIEAFRRFVAMIPEEGLLAAWAGDPTTRRVCKTATARIHFFAIEGEDCGGLEPYWVASDLVEHDSGCELTLRRNGQSMGRFISPLSGDHNIRNALGALILASEGAGGALLDLALTLPRFEGARRRQELIGVANGIRVYDDFAHHPTAVRETLAGLRRRHAQGRLIAAFEPRSATASRRLHQDQYPAAFEVADMCFLAPVGRREVPKSEQLDLDLLASEIEARGAQARVCGDIDSLVERVADCAQSGDTVVLMSNGAFGNAPRRIFDRLKAD